MKNPIALTGIKTWGETGGRRIVLCTASGVWFGRLTRVVVCPDSGREK
jgi:hypothetical protein